MDAHSSGAPAPLQPLNEIHIRMDDELGTSDYFGTRAMLEAEGLIPDGTVWPNGFEGVTVWSIGELRFYLRRQRPDGAKGPRSQYLNVDWWCLRWGTSALETCYFERQSAVLIRIQSNKLREAVWEATPEGRREVWERSRRLIAAWNDKNYQSFRSLIPALAVRKSRRGRPPKHSEHTQQAQG